MKAIRNAMMRNAVGWMALLSLAVSVRAGVVVEQEGGEVGGNKPKTKMTLYLDSGKLRMEGQQPDGKKFAVIFDSNQQDRKSTRLNSSHIQKSRMPSSA